MMAWWAGAPSPARRALVAAWLGWALDGMDVMLYAMVLAHVMRDLHLVPATAGLLASLTLASSAVGGAVVGILADRLGRTWAMQLSILLYSVFTAACGLAQSAVALGLFRVLLGFGMGGEWATGAALVAETWPAEHRGKALGVMQSAWAVGYAAAACVTALVLPRWGWRAVFFAGILPAFVTLWIRRRVPESEVWRTSRAASAAGGVGALFRPPLARWVVVAATVSAASMFGWWGLFTWIPSYLGLPRQAGGAGLDVVTTSTWVILMQVGMWLGYLSFGALADRLGRRRTYVAYLFLAAALVPIYGQLRHATALLVLGPIVAFFGTGYFVGFGVITAELFPTRVRATAQGFTYNVGRGISAVAPFAVGSLAGRWGLGLAFNLVAVSFLVAGSVAMLLPETRGREIEPA